MFHSLFKYFQTQNEYMKEDIVALIIAKCVYENFLSTENLENIS